MSDFHHFYSRPFSIVVNPSQTIRKVLSLPATTTMEYKSNNGEYISTRQYFLSDILIGDQTRCKINQASVSLLLVNVRPCHDQECFPPCISYTHEDELSGGLV